MLSRNLLLVHRNTAFYLLNGAPNRKRGVSTNLQDKMGLKFCEPFRELAGVHIGNFLTASWTEPSGFLLIGSTTYNAYLHLPRYACVPTAILIRCIQQKTLSKWTFSLSTRKETLQTQTIPLPRSVHFWNSLAFLSFKHWLTPQALTQPTSVAYNDPNFSSYSKRKFDLWKNEIYRTFSCWAPHIHSLYYYLCTGSTGKNTYICSCSLLVYYQISKSFCQYFRERDNGYC